MQVLCQSALCSCASDRNPSQSNQKNEITEILHNERDRPTKPYESRAWGNFGDFRDLSHSGFFLFCSLCSSSCFALDSSPQTNILLDYELWLLKPPDLQLPSLASSFFIFFLWVLLRNIWHISLYNLRCSAWRFDLHIRWSDYQNKFSDHLSPPIDTRQRKEIFSTVMRALRIYSFNNFLYTLQQG